MSDMFTLGQVSAKWKLHEDKKEPERWIATQLKAGRFRGKKFGQKWRMSAEDIAHAEMVVANTVPVVPPVSVEERRGPTLASLQRRMSA
jgi:hypothetical protein